MRLGRRRPKLLTLGAIAAETGARFGTHPLELGDLVLKRVRAGGQVSRLEVELGSPLPEAFGRCISRYSLDHLSWHVAFGQGRGYARYLIEANVEPLPAGKVGWWKPYERPDRLIMIGQSDVFVVLLELDDGSVRAFRGGQDPRRALTAAADFELFLRGLGTLLLQGPQDELLRSWVAQQVGGDAGFWRIV